MSDSCSFFSFEPYVILLEVDSNLHVLLKLDICDRKDHGDSVQALESEVKKVHEAPSLSHSWQHTSMTMS